MPVQLMLLEELLDRCSSVPLEVVIAELKRHHIQYGAKVGKLKVKWKHDVLLGRRFGRVLPEGASRENYDEDFEGYFLVHPSIAVNCAWGHLDQGVATVVAIWGPERQRPSGTEKRAPKALRSPRPPVPLALVKPDDLGPLPVPQHPIGALEKTGGLEIPLELEDIYVTRTSAEAVFSALHGGVGLSAVEDWERDARDAASYRAQPPAKRSTREATLAKKNEGNYQLVVGALAEILAAESADYKVGTRPNLSAIAKKITDHLAERGKHASGLRDSALRKRLNDAIVAVGGDAFADDGDATSEPDEPASRSF